MAAPKSTTDKKKPRTGAKGVTSPRAKTPKTAAPRTKTRAKPPVTVEPAAPVDNSPRARFQAWAAQPDNAAMEELCAFIVAGEEQGHLKAFCGEHGFNYTTALAWIARDPARSELYARAREDRSDTIAERILSVADEDCTTPIMGTQIIDGVLVEVEVGRKVDPAKVQLLRLKSDNLKWSASKLKPKMYGDKLDVNANINTNELSDQELARRLAGFGIDIIAIAGAAPGSSHGG